MVSKFFTTRSGEDICNREAFPVSGLVLLMYEAEEHVYHPVGYESAWGVVSTQSSL